MSKVLDTLTNLTRTSYTVGGKSSGSFPVEVTLKLDPEFRKTVLQLGGMLALGIAVGVGVGVASSRSRRRQ